MISWLILQAFYGQFIDYEEFPSQMAAHLDGVLRGSQFVVYQTRHTFIVKQHVAILTTLPTRSNKMHITFHMHHLYAFESQILPIIRDE